MTIKEGKKVYLRDTVFSDLEMFAKWETDINVTRFFTISDDRNYEEIVTEYFSRRNDDDKMELSICEVGTDKLVGRLYISNIDHHYDSLDITRIYIGDLSKRGKGYGEETLTLMLDYAFNDLGLHRVTLDHFDENIPAHTLYVKAGFVPEGCMRQSGKKNGKYINLNLMSMLRDEYYAKYGK